MLNQLNPSYTGHEHTFTLSHGFIPSAYLGIPDIAHDDLLPLTRGELSLSTPLRVKHHLGKHLRDVIWLSSLAPVISERIANALVTNGVTGWAEYPVAVEAKDGTLIGGYVGLAITGRCGPIDWEKRPIVQRQFPGGTFPYYRGYLFDPQSWDGSDLFQPTNIGWMVFALQAVVTLLKSFRPTNLTFDRIGNLERSAGSIPAQ